jgi:hypothetical protein
MAFGKCPMCKLDKKLVKSHLIPRALYNYCRATGSEPILITTKVMVHTSKQTKYHLLCSDCEGVLSEGGEKWLLPKLATIKGKFPFLDILRSKSPEFAEPDLVVYAAATNPGIRVGKLVHFGLGIFWKASVHHWGVLHEETLIDLGEYGEKVRAFLKGEADFPDDIALTLHVSPPPTTLISFFLPFEGRAAVDGLRLFYFYVCGLRFTLSIRRNIGDLRGICLHSNPEHLILVEDISPEINAMFRESAKNARKSGKVLQYMNKRKP